MSTANERAPRFELHIRPMVRFLDFGRMRQATNVVLWDYDSVRSNAPSILKRLQADMPPKPFGGLWPQEWVDLFERWTETDFRRLEIGRPNLDWEVTRDNDVVTIMGQSELPDELYEGWIQPEMTLGTARCYTLYWQDPDELPQPPLSPREVVFQESFSPEPDETHVLIVDADGEHRFAI